MLPNTYSSLINSGKRTSSNESDAMLNFSRWNLLRLGLTKVLYVFSNILWRQYAFSFLMSLYFVESLTSSGRVLLIDRVPP
jgi:hypothetical protein